MVHGPPVDGQAHGFAHPLVTEGILRVLESGELQPPGSGEHRRQHDARKLSDLVDQLAGNEVDDIRLAALQHGDTGGRLWHRDHHQLLHVHGTVVAVEGLQLDLHAWLVADEPVGTSSDWFLLEGVGAHLLVVLLRHHPAGPRDIRGPEEDGEVEEGLFEEEADRAIVHDLHALRLPFEDVGLGAPVVLIAELDILRSDRLAVVEPDPLPQRERGALRIRGDREVLGQSGMVVERGALILDEGVVDRGEEVVWRGGAVVLLGVQPAGCEPGVPGEDDLALGRRPGR